MKLNKKSLFQIHSWIGVKLSILFFIVCFSGTLATLSNEMDWLFYPGLRASGDGDRKSYNQLAREVQKAYPDGELTYWEMGDEPYLNDIVYVELEGQRYYVFVDPVKGQVTGSTTVTFQRFFRDFHYYLFMPFNQIGYFIVLVFAFFLLVSMITPLFFYKKWWNKLFELKTGKGLLVLFRSLHRVVGLWTVPFALLMSITGIWYFIERTNIGRVSDISNPLAPKLEEKAHSYDATSSITYQLDYDRAATLALEKIPGLQIGNIVPGSKVSEPIYINGKSHVPLVRKRSNRVYVDPVSYRVVGLQKAEEIPTTMYLNDIADPLHFGNWGGLTTKIIWFFGGLAICSLILSGIWIALKRQAKQVAEKGLKVLGVWKYLNWGISLTILGYMYYFMVDRYAASWSSILLVTSVLGFLALMVWYLFDFRLKKSVKSIV
ncbi:MAG TPA: PepSY-associated TM helix domain-containing protein [Algoriphagus sp.]|nr:PepSY-associated TM helix domain-containing protein [Algoriphagus sp.]